MKIAFFSPEWPHGANGIIPYVRCISRALHELGHEVIVLSFHVHGQIGYEKAVQIPAPRRAPLVVRAIRRLFPGIGGRFDSRTECADAIAGSLEKVKRHTGVDVFEMEETFGWCALVADRTEVPVVVRLHGPHFLNGVYERGRQDPLDQRQLLHERCGIERAAAVTSPSRQVLQATTRYYGLTREAWVIPNPIPLSEMDLHWSMNACDRNTVLFVGRTDNRKGGDLVIRMFDLLLKQRPALKLHFVGPDKGFVDAEAGVSFDEYVTSRYGANVRNQIVYHGTRKPPEIAALRLKSHVTVVLSRYENFPTVCMEALASGCPLVAASVGGIPEIVFDNVTGLLAESEDVEDMASKVAQLLNDEGLCIRLGTAGRALCRNEFHPRKVANQMLAIYAHAMEQH